VIPETQYAKTPGGVHLAYQTAGEGPIDLVWQFDLIFGNVELVWETVVGDFLRKLSSFSRMILHDRRGTGLSSRNVAPPNLETRVGDLEVILDAIGSERPVLGGHGEGGASNVLFAASRPERVHSVVWSRTSTTHHVGTRLPVGSRSRVRGTSRQGDRRVVGLRGVRSSNGRGSRR
jgi:hypothetical protein